MANRTPPLTQGERDRLYELLGGLLVTYSLRERIAFMRRAGLSIRWITNHNWDGSPIAAAQLLVDTAASTGIPLEQNRPGYTTLGCILDQLLREEMVGDADGRFVAEVIVRCELIRVDEIEVAVSPGLRVLLDRAAKEAAQRRAAQLADLWARLTAADGRKEWDAVIAAGEEIIWMDPNYQSVRAKTANAYRNRGVNYQAQGDYDRAIADLSRAIELAPQTANYYRDRAVSHQKQGDYEQSIGDLNRAIELAPQTADYYRGRGGSYYLQGAYEQAVDDLNQAIELAPQTAEYYQGRAGSYHAQGDYARAIADFNRAIELAPQTADYYRERGLSYAAQSDYTRAIADYNRAIELAPQTAIYYRERGVSSHNKGDYDQAIADLNQAIELDPIVGDYYYCRGLSYKKKGNREAARRDFQRALELDHTSAQTQLDKL